MSADDPCSELSARRLETLILRLVLDEQGRLLCGQLLDTQGLLSERFVGWEEMVHLLRARLMPEADGLPDSSRDASTDPRRSGPVP